MMHGKIAVEEHYERPPIAAAANNAFKQDRSSYIENMAANAPVCTEILIRID
jgi:hypothetical protein